MFILSMFIILANNTLPGNDRITKEFYEVFWEGLKTPLILSVNKAFKGIVK